MKPTWAAKKANKHASKKLRAGRGTVGKTAIVGAKDRKTNKIKAAVVKATDAKTLQGFVIATAIVGATVFTDDAAAYKGMPFDHESVRHSVGEYVDGMGPPYQWHRELLEHAEKGAQGHLPQDQRQAPANDTWTNLPVATVSRERDKLDQMQFVVSGMVGKRITYRDLVA